MARIDPQSRAASDRSTEAAGRIVAATQGGVLTIRISNPARYNVLSMQMWEDLGAQVAQANGDKALRVVVLEGDGARAFAAGADISEFKEFRSDPKLVERFNSAVLNATRALASCLHPTVALIRGICMGGGMSLAQSCDLRYCADDARFRMPAGRLGIGYSPEDVSRFAGVVGAARTADLFLTARTFSGREAERIGYVQECFAAEDFAALAAARVAAVAHMAPLTLRAFKLALRAAMGGAQAPAADAVDQAFAACFASADYQEGQRAFRERREPRFEGR